MLHVFRRGRFALQSVHLGQVVHGVERARVLTS